MGRELVGLGSASPTSGVFFIAVTMLTTPAGMPARTESSAIAAAVKGVSPGDFATTVQPAARAGPIFRVIIAAGKFQGVMRPQTPTGSLMVKTLFPTTLAGIVSPYARGASSLNHSKKFAAYVTSPFASAIGFPFSHVMSFARSSAFSTMRSYHFRSNLDLSLPVFFRNSGSAAAAASMASFTSSLFISGMVPMGL